MVKDVKGDYFVDGHVFQAHGTLTIKRAKVTTGTGRVIFIQRGVGIIHGVLLAADKVGASIGVSFEGAAKRKINDTNINSND